MWLPLNTIIGQHISLEPLEEQHTPELVEAVKDGESWKLWYANVPEPETMSDFVSSALKKSVKEHRPYVVRRLQDDKIVGTTRFYDVEESHRRANIGYTWYSASVRKTAINTEAKYLLLKTLFDDGDAMAAHFKTHFFNQASRTAIERLGAKQDGIIRHHMIMADGSVRDTVLYSIIKTEWPAVKNNLLAKLDQ